MLDGHKRAACKQKAQAQLTTKNLPSNHHYQLLAILLAAISDYSLLSYLRSSKPRVK
jgi:hypothetical protein